MRAAAAVARLLTLDPATGKRGYATGFMVAPRLLLTNRHVLPNIGVARASMAEFGYEYDVSGNTKDTEVFKLAPDEVFILGNAANEDADFALVAVAPLAERSQLLLTSFGYLRLDDQPGKVAEKEFITIIQHPCGRHKQIALRENEVIAKGSNDRRPVLLYRSDTAPGSSGSPCFNDQWQVVALHSRGVPKTEDGNPQQPGSVLAYEANLGVRISFIVGSIRKTPEAATQQLLVDFLTDVQRGGPPVVQLNMRRSTAFSHPNMQPLQQRIGKQFSDRAAIVETAIDFAEGYDPNFLGVYVPLPKISANALRYGHALIVPETGDIELTYPHYSVIMNEDRRLAFVSACNIDGALKRSVKPDK
eukprot:GHRR01024956.1.p1 GENE.GHRR01024956.1~~GHRR01024956.1.p1  ORF type:complete len:361 (+),score=112.02 GHRR01024956.1:777-1859(+)